MKKKFFRPDPEHEDIAPLRNLLLLPLSYILYSASSGPDRLKNMLHGLAALGSRPVQLKGILPGLFWKFKAE